ncbi:MAG: restriction endonuclease, partial [Chloroflexi bacterium]
HVGQRAGALFEQITKDFLEKAFSLLNHLRPGEWEFFVASVYISRFEQYEHLATLSEFIQKQEELMATLGIDYIIKPDIVIGRRPVSDGVINQHRIVIEPELPLAVYTPLREHNRPSGTLILHASISCKWTIRSDRAQNTRTEALNLIRNRKGHTPHIVAVTAEPLPTRIASLALGTGDIDCVYHFALSELQIAIEESGNQDQADMLYTLINGRRLRDISDLPFDLAI